MTYVSDVASQEEFRTNTKSTIRCHHSNVDYYLLCEASTHTFAICIGSVTAMEASAALQVNLGFSKRNEQILC